MKAGSDRGCSHCACSSQCSQGLRDNNNINNAVTKEQVPFINKQLDVDVVLKAYNIYRHNVSREVGLQFAFQNKN